MAGTWREVQHDRYLSAFFVMIPQGGGYLKVIQESRTIDEDEILALAPSLLFAGLGTLNGGNPRH